MFNFATFFVAPSDGNFVQNWNCSYFLGNWEKITTHIWQLTSIKRVWPESNLTFQEPWPWGMSWKNALITFSNCDLFQFSVNAWLTIPSTVAPLWRLLLAPIPIIPTLLWELLSLELCASNTSFFTSTYTHSSCFMPNEWTGWSRMNCKSTSSLLYFKNFKLLQMRSFYDLQHYINLSSFLKVSFIFATRTLLEMRS